MEFVVKILLCGTNQERYEKISYYLIFIVIAGLVLVSFWVYQKYFSREETPPMLFKVERGDIREIIKVKGEAISQKEFNLEFPFSGIVEKVFVKEGEDVRQGAKQIEDIRSILKIAKPNLNYIRGWAKKSSTTEILEEIISGLEKT